MATYEMIEGERVLVRKTKVPGLDNQQDLPEKKAKKEKPVKTKQVDES